MGELPSGRLTLLFTDIEGSTRLVSSLGEAYGPVLDEHHRLVRDAIAAHGGVEVSTTGDSFFIVFLDALDGTRAAAAIQRALAEHAWPSGTAMRVRMGLHVGHTVLVGREYVGLDVHRASRVADAANGGQVLLSEEAQLAICDRLPAGLATIDVGRHRLKDVGAEHLWRLQVAGLPDDPRRPRSIEANPTNLPVAPTELVDRERECREVLELVASSRIVTVTGPGGAGKTRVALRVAREAIPSFPDGVFHLDLATAGDVEVALRGIAEVLGLPPAAAESPLHQLVASARRRRLLLVLDTADQVIGLGAALAAVAAGSSTVAVLVTSRSPLRVAAEHEYPLGPLDSHAPGGADPGPAVALFLERARAVRPDLAVDAAALATIAAICDRVDGLPLAIELAAARVKVLSPAAILARLAHQLPILTGGAADAPARQRTLRDTIAWSYGLLDAGEQAVLQRLAAFVSSFDVAAAEAIVGPHPDVLGALEHLVDRSLLTVSLTEAEPRFRLLGAIREFALEMLDTSDVAAAVREAHARHLLDVVEARTAAIGSTGEAAALEALERVMDDARAALAWAVDEPADPARAELAIRLAGRLGRYWWLRGRVGEGSAWLERVLEHGESAPPSARAVALYWAGVLLDDRGDAEGADRRLTAALAIQRKAGDEAAAARTLNSLGVVAHSRGDPERAQRLLWESLDLKDRRGLERERATTLHNLATVAASQQRYGEAIALYEEALTYDSRVGAHGAESFSRIGLGAVRIMAGDDARGAAEVRAALPQLADLGAVDALADALDALGEAAAHESRPDRAARLLLAAGVLRERESVAQRPPDAARAAGVLAGVAAQLVPAELEAARTDARAMDVAAAVAYALTA